MLFAVSAELLVALVLLSAMLATRNPLYGAAFLVAFVIVNIIQFALGGETDNTPPTAGA